MKPNTIALGLALLGLAAPAAAEGLQEDVRCLLLSGVYMKTAPDDKGKQIARLTGAFFLGRIDGRLDEKALAALVLSESKAIDPKAAGPQMDACAAKLTQAQKTMNDVGRSLAPAK